ncbi:hypothetical protein Syun_011166 [Stephania yunnanensis]|uniref:Uncharacterized protein n=1 Tax=Stephania yunnanensis TaxID=152371 RepID=A0AAP0JX98_9MAGN
MRLVANIIRSQVREMGQYWETYCKDFGGSSISYFFSLPRTTIHTPPRHHHTHTPTPKHHKSEEDQSIREATKPTSQVSSHGFIRAVRPGPHHVRPSRPDDLPSPGPETDGRIDRGSLVNREAPGDCTPDDPADMGPRRPAFKLQERRQGGRKLEISLGFNNGHSNCNNRQRTTPWVKGVLGGDHNAVLVSPVSPFDLFSRGSASPRTPSDEEMVQMEERAIAEKGFFFHPSPRGPDPPELLPLFPLHSPREPY